MSQSTTTRLRHQIVRLHRGEDPGLDLGLDGILSVADLTAILEEEGATWKSIVYTPLLTTWAFLWQMLNPDRSCRAAVKRIAAWLASRGKRLANDKDDPYIKARQRLPETVPARLMKRIGHRCHERAADAWRWCGRTVKSVDGTTVSMPDTPANQAEYPQSRSQAPGLGFPLARLVVVFCLATGAVLESAIGAARGKKTGETSLFRGLWDSLEAGEVVLADRLYCSYFDIAMLKARGVDVVFRLHQHRKCDFRCGRRLGREDRIVSWPRPGRPDWMDGATYEQVPEDLEVRQIRVRVAARGFRTRVVDIVTTLLDAEVYTKVDIAALYRQRWHAELDLRSIKIALGMDVLRCKTPEMVRKEIGMALAGYNVVRALMAKAAKRHGREPRRLSFKGAQQALLGFAEELREGSAAKREWLWEIILEGVANDEVGDRPDRVEPRARKRRPKPYPLLMKPRNKARAASLDAA
ncbi:MAG: IS4 family transposase, partial [Isosphaeraceae bacterium]